MVALTLEGQFLAALEFIDRVVDSTCRQQGLFGDDADDFKSSVHEKLIADDYAVFRKFRGGSSLETYLTVCIKNRFRDYRIQKWGKWRPSAKARSMGTTTVQLETLMSRDGRSLDEAHQILLDSGGRLSRAEVVSLAAQLPQRSPRRFESEEKLHDVPTPHATDGSLMHHEKSLAHTHIENLLERATRTLPDEDRVIMRMRYLDGLSVADVARGLGIEQKPLYERIKRNLVQLREILESEGVHRSDAMELLA